MEVHKRMLMSPAVQQWAVSVSSDTEQWQCQWKVTVSVNSVSVSEQCQWAVSVSSVSVSEQSQWTVSMNSVSVSEQFSWVVSVSVSSVSEQCQWAVSVSRGSLLVARSSLSLLTASAAVSGIRMVEAVGARPSLCPTEYLPYQACSTSMTVPPGLFPVL